MVQILTDAAIRSLSEGVLYDRGRIPGFGIRAGKTRKTWFLIAGKNKTKVTLGHYPDMSLAEARKRALMALATHAEPTNVPTFVDARQEFFEKHTPNLRPRSAYQITRNLKRHFDWHKPLDEITHADVANAIDAIKAPSQRAHALKDVRTFFNWCIPKYLKYSPCVGLKKAPQKARDRILADAELKALWKATDDGKIFSNIVRLLILTGQRRGEIAQLQTSWLGENELTIPKDVAKNGREHTFPIGSMSKSLLESCLATESTRFLFPARGSDASPTPFNGWMKCKLALDKKLGTNFEPWTLHDLRRTFSSNLAALHVPQEVTERLLNHVSGKVSGVAAIYNRYAYMDEMREAITHYERWLSGLIA